MPKMDDTTLRAMLASQHAAALSASNASKLSTERSKALDYYNGIMPDMQAAVGRSSAVSMDVADTTDGILPQMMEIFAGTDEVVKFEPVGPEDVQAAEQETDYINHVFMNMNPGFMVLHDFIKDALLEKLGVVKVWWEKTDSEEKETYLDKSPDEFAMIVASPDVEMTEHTEHDGLHDVTVVHKKTYAQARVMGVPPEEFGTEAGTRNIRDCNYAFHKIVTNTEAGLIEQGYDEAQIKALPTYRAWSNSEENSRDTVEGGPGAGSDVNSASRLVEITEHYVRMDYEGNGKACLYRVTTGGQQGEILKLDGEPDVIEFDVIPFAVMTPIPVPHRLIGQSLADKSMDIQKVKTALWRGALDALYIALNPRVVVSENGASENTLDDLLVSRPNQIVRVKQNPSDTIAYQTSPDVSKSVYPALEYMDQRLETRTGFSKRGQGIEPDALSNQSATAAKIVENASQARVRLMARIFAETGVKDLFSLLHGVIKKHGDKPQQVRLKNNWVTVDPRNWKSREDLTVHVGLGTGGRAQAVAELTMLASLQKDALVNGLTNLVTVDNLYATAKDLTKAIGKANVEAYFTDPKTQPPLQPKPDPKVMELQMKAQLDERADQRKSQLDMQSQQSKAQIETVQAQADIATQQQKTQAEMVMAERKAQLEERLMLLDYELKREMQQAELQMKRELHEHTLAQSQMGMVANAQTHEAKMKQMKAKPSPSNG